MGMVISEIKRFRDLQKIIRANKFQAGKRFLSDDASKQSKTNLYDTLCLQSSATPSEIKKAYYDLSFKYHPDRNENNAEASKKFREVTEAYEVLGNYGLKKRYDKGLPLPLSKRTTSPLRPAQEPNVPLQKFFDSRQSKSHDGGPIEDEIPEMPKETEMSRRQKRFEDEFESSKSIRGVLAAFIIVAILVYRFS